MLKVLSIPPELAMDADFTATVYVLGNTPLPLSQPFKARFDDEPIEVVTVDNVGTGFLGYMAQRPAEGAHLVVEFEGEEPIDTGLVYHAEEPPIA
jgi:hypothetical protein